MTVPVQDAFDRLLKSYGPQRWWPGEGPFEILVGTVLVQNTNWRNVEKAIDNLREAGVMTPEKLFALDPEELSELIRPAGYYQVKTKRLRNLLRLIVDRYDGSLETRFAGDRHALLEELQETLAHVAGGSAELLHWLSPSAGSKILPGFRIPLGSNTFLMPRISSISAALRE